MLDIYLSSICGKKEGNGFCFTQYLKFLTGDSDERIKVGAFVKLDFYSLVNFEKFSQDFLLAAMQDNQLLSPGE